MDLRCLLEEWIHRQRPRASLSVITDEHGEVGRKGNASGWLLTLRGNPACASISPSRESSMMHAPVALMMKNEPEAGWRATPEG